MRYLELHKNYVRTVAYSPDGTYLATGGNDRHVKFVNVATGEVQQPWDMFFGPILSVAFQPGGEMIAIAGQFPYVYLGRSLGGKPKLLDDLSKAPWDALKSPNRVIFSPNGKKLAIGCGDRNYGFDKVRFGIVDTHSHNWSDSHTVSQGIWDMAFLRDNDQIILGTGFGWMHCRLSSWSESVIKKQNTGTKAIAVSPDNTIFAAVSGRSIVVWGIGEAEFLGYLLGHEANVTSLVFTPNGKHLLSGSWDQTVRVWDMVTMQQTAAFDWQRGKVQCLACAPDGMTAAAGCDRGVVIWDLDE